MKKNKTRQDAFKKLRLKGLSLRQIGELQKPPISPERVRQIIVKEKPTHYCKVHKLYFSTGCRICNLNALYAVRYKSLIEAHKEKDLKAELKRLSIPDRTQEMVAERVEMILFLKDVIGFSFVNIGKLLKRNHTTIIKMYYKNKGPADKIR